LIFFIGAVGYSAVSDAAVYYVRQGASGNGSNWTSAFGQLPAQLVRGSTYYISDGTYSSYTFDDAESSDAALRWITIKKATIDNHGPALDGSSYLSDFNGQAVFGSLAFHADYFDFNGQTRNESNWQDTPSYGFRTSTINIGLVDGARADHIRLKYVDVGSAQGTVYPNVVNEAIYIRMAETYQNDIYIGYSHIHNCIMPIHSRKAHDVTLENNHIGPSFGKEAISHQYGNRWIIRHNRFIDNLAVPNIEAGTAVIGIWDYSGGADYDPSTTFSDDNEIYGNIFGGSGQFDLTCTQAVIYGNLVHNWKVYNNVLYNLDGSWASIEILGTNNKVYNTLWYKVRYYGPQEPSLINCSVSGTNSVCDNSWCFEDNPYDDGQARVNADCEHLPNTKYLGSENPFIDPAKMDFRLKANFSGPSPINTGRTLGAGYNPIDYLGVTRGAGGAWDIGALEFTGAVVANTPHPADTGPDGTPNNKIEPDEATTFGACWKTNCKTEANMNNAVRAGTLWNASADGEYKYELSAGACPLCWVVAP
jgi:hypothetical protein